MRGVAKGPRRHASTKFLENVVILGFEKRYAYPKQNSVIRLKPNILAPTTYF